MSFYNNVECYVIALWLLGLDQTEIDRFLVNNRNEKMRKDDIKVFMGELSMTKARNILQRN